MRTRVPITIATTLVVLAIVVLAGLAQADAFTWTGGTTGEWTDQANWGDGVSGYPNAAGDIANFTVTTGKHNVNVASPVTVGYIKGSSPSGAGSSWNNYLLDNLTGNGTGSITLDNNGAGATLDWYWVNMNQVGNHTVSVPLIMADNVKLQTRMGNNPFYLNSKISESGGPRMLTIEFARRDAWPGGAPGDTVIGARRPTPTAGARISSPS